MSLEITEDLIARQSPEAQAIIRLLLAVSAHHGQDLGELVFVQARPHGPLVRVVELSVDEQVRAVGELLEQRLTARAGTNRRAICCLPQMQTAAAGLR